MSSRVAGIWGLAVCGIAGACGEQDPTGATCGPGTVRQGAVCVVAHAGAGNTGGDPSCSGSDCGGAGTVAGVGGTGMGVEGDGGAVSGGVGNGLGGNGNDQAGTGSSDGGASSSAMAGAAGDGAGGDGNAPGVNHWLGIENNGSSYVYDLSQFPSQNAIHPLGDARLGSWSPNGQKLLHGDQGAWYVRDMSGAIPGTAILLVDPPGALPVLHWSADSESLAMVTGSTLTVFATDQDAPPLNTVTSTLTTFSWCPIGNKLLYLDSLGAHIVTVQAGVLGAPLDVNANMTTWSPTGQALLGPTAVFGLTYTDLSGASPMLTPLFEPSPPDQGLEGYFFSPDGSRIATSGWKDDVEREDAFFVNVLPSVGPLTTAYSTPPVDVNSASIAWSPDSNFLIYDTDGALFAVDVSGSGTRTPFPLDPAPSYEPTWLPNSNKVITLDTSTSPTAVAIFDLQAPSSPQPLMSGVPFIDFELNPEGTTFAYRTQLALHLVNIAAPQQPHVDIPLLSLSGNISSWGWSPDGNFIAAVAGSASRQLRLVRIDGTTPSSPVDLTNLSVASVRFEWQP